MGGPNGPRCLVQFVSVAKSAMSTMRARYRFADLVSLPVYYLPMAPLDGPCGRSTFNCSAQTQLWLKTEV